MRPPVKLPASGKAKPSGNPAPKRPAKPVPAALPPTPEIGQDRLAKAPVGGRNTLPKRSRGFGKVLFALLVVLPTIVVGAYYALMASEQFRSEMRFAVRGTNSSPLTQLGLGALPGNSSQAADAYIVIDYISSTQVLRDIREQLGIDMRSFFSRSYIDPIYRIDADMPFEEFLWYWQWMTDASFNSTTSITTFRVYAFSAADAKTITDAILQVASKLVNDLSTEARTQLIATAQTEVGEKEARLAEARATLTAFRNREQSLNPTQQAASDQELIQGLQRELIDLNARRTALRTSVSQDSPSVRILDRQIQAAQLQLDAQRQAIGSGDNVSAEGDRSLAVVLGDYSGLALEEEFAAKAYTAALSSLETAEAEARKQERYFAIIVEPTEPEVALYPYRFVNTLIAFAVFAVIWLLAYLVVQAVRDHAA